MPRAYPLIDPVQRIPSTVDGAAERARLIVRGLIVPADAQRELEPTFWHDEPTLRLDDRGLKAAARFSYSVGRFSR
jgi:hypothetical protein